MLATLRQRDFSLLWFAGLISFSGNWMLGVALPVAVYTLTGSPLAIGGLLLANIVPGILFSSLAGVFVDRWERRRTIVIVNLLLAVSILPLLLVNSPETVWLVYAVQFAQSTLNQFFVPAENALLPLLSDPKLLVTANALNALNNNLARLVGPAIGGVVAVSLGLGGVVTFDLLSYIVAAGLVALISVSSHPGKTDEVEVASAARKIVREWWEGLRLIWQNATVRVLFTFNVLTAIGESVMYVLFIPFVTEVLHGDTLHYGGLVSAQAVGGIIGGVVISRIAPRFKTYKLLGFSAIVFGLIDLATFNYSTFVSGIFLAYFFMVVVGPVAVSVNAGYNTLLQSSVNTAYQGRVVGTMSLIFSLFMLSGIGFASSASERFGIVPVINIQGYVFILAGIICLVALRDRSTTPAVIAPELAKLDR